MLFVDGIGDEFFGELRGPTLGDHPAEDLAT
jgi:hypothetical protein